MLLVLVFIVLVVISTLLYMKFHFSSEVVPDNLIDDEPVATSTDQIVDEVPLPRIDTINPSSGPAGTVINLNGKNLAGFEGDLDAWIENAQGERAYLSSASSSYQRTELIQVKIEGKLCKQNNSYSGNPCTEYMNITPGKYMIYTAPWGKVSNKVEFEVK